MAPRTTLEWLNALKASHLKALAGVTGATSSGTKPTLISHLRTHLQHGLAASEDTQNRRRSPLGQLPIQHDIISIDMGIRNLAYCRITIPPSWELSSKSSTAPKVKEWKRIAVSSLGATPGLGEANGFISSQKTEVLTSSRKEPSTRSPKETFEPLAYSSHAYNLIARILQLPQPDSSTLASPTSPSRQSHGTSPSANPITHILIERQRFRSMGGSAVQEWTLRVNMFEAMLYAVLRTLRETGFWHGSVHPIVPGRVVKFWLGDEEAVVNEADAEDAEVEQHREGGEGEEEEEDAKSGLQEDAAEKANGSESRNKQKGRKSMKKVPTSAKAGNGTRRGKGKTPKSKPNTKMVKVKMVEHWLEDLALHPRPRLGSTYLDLAERPHFEMEGEAAEMAARFLKKRRGGMKGNADCGADDATANTPPATSVDAAPMGKLDDLADCLMQGMAWVKWEENRRRILKDGEACLKRLDI